MSSFRKEVFDICKKIKKDEKATKIQELLHRLNTVNINKDTKSISNKINGDFVMVAKRFGNQFHGYLFVDDNVESINSQKLFAVEKLSKDDRSLFEVGHKSIMGVVNECLEEITIKFPNIGNVMNPYSLLKEVKCDTDNEMVLSDEEIEKVANSFKSSEVYKTFFDSIILEELEKINIDRLRMMVGSLEKEINKSYFNPANSEIDLLWKKIVSNTIGLEDRVFGIIVLLYALRASLAVACQLLYEAIGGGNLIVFNNDNLISIEKNQANCICDFYKVIVQGGFLNSFSGTVGEVALLDCELPNEQLVHKFGLVNEATISMSSEMGCTSKYSFTVLNDELININQIVESIISSGMLN